MKTISNKILLRLAAQANEADIYGDIRTADNLTSQIEKYSQSKVRSNDEDYEYAKEELVEDLEKILWEGATRIFDYYDETPDAKQIQEIIDSEVESFLESIENLIHKDIGPNEPEVPGEEDPELEDDNVVEEDSEKIFSIPEDDDDEEDTGDEDDTDEDEEEDDDDDEDEK